MVRTKNVKTESAQSARRNTHSQVTWEAINEPGAYVERGSGDLYRFAKESLALWDRPAIVKESLGSSLLVKLSEDPFISTFRARLLSAQFNIAPNF